MNYIKHLSGFFDKVSKDDRLNPTHVSLYVSLFQFWNACRFHNPISISRNEAMKVSKINSKATYHKCMRELNDFGYLSYQPSYNPFKGSLVYLFNFQAGVNKVDNQPKIETSPELALNGYRTKNETSSELALNKQRTSSEQALVSYINNTNNTNIINNTNRIKQKARVNAKKENAFSKNNNDLKFISDEKSKKKKSVKRENTGSEKKEKSSGKKEKVTFVFEEKSFTAQSRGKSLGDAGKVNQNRNSSDFKRPTAKVVETYFLKKQWPEVEGQKFFNYYESNGWLIGGKSPMQNWQAAADSWMLKTAQFNATDLKATERANIGTNKDYSEPL